MRADRRISLGASLVACGDVPPQRATVAASTGLSIYDVLAPIGMLRELSAHPVAREVELARDRVLAVVAVAEH